MTDFICSFSFLKFILEYKTLKESLLTKRVLINKLIRKTPPLILGPTRGQLALTLQPNPLIN